MSISIRNINKETDLEIYVELYNLAHADYPEHRPLSIEIAKRYVFDDPDFDEKFIFLAFDGSKVIGRARGDMETETVGFISTLILPEYRSKELEEMLYDKVWKEFNVLIKFV